MGVELWRPPREIENHGRVLFENLQDPVDILPVHQLRPVRTRLDMTVSAGHDASIAEVDLHNLNPKRPERSHADF
jgi:hypothetical protein